MCPFRGNGIQKNSRTDYGDNGVFFSFIANSALTFIYRNLGAKCFRKFRLPFERLGYLVPYIGAQVHNWVLNQACLVTRPTPYH